jgi:hypothetical protein
MIMLSHLSSAAADLVQIIVRKSETGSRGRLTLAAGSQLGVKVSSARFKEEVKPMGCSRAAEVGS